MRLSDVLINLLRTFLLGDDRFLVMRTAECIGGLCRSGANETAMLELLDVQTVDRLLELVSAKDVLLSTTTLSAIYNVSFVIVNHVDAQCQPTSAAACVCVFRLARLVV